MHKVKSIEPERQKPGRQKSCQQVQQVQHAKLYSDLLQAYKVGIFDSLELPLGRGGGLNVCITRRRNKRQASKGESL